MAAIRFLTQTGQRSDNKREEFILLSGGTPTGAPATSSFLFQP